MTLVAGFKCRDGFVIAADTEVTHGSILFQGHKIDDHFGESRHYSVIIGGAGDFSYIKMASQKIRDAVATLDEATIPKIKGKVDEIVDLVYSKYIFKHWKASDEEHCPSFDLVIGIEDQNRNIAIIATDRTSVFEIGECTFAGSGMELAEHLTEKLWVPGMSVSVTSHLALQIFREVKGKGTSVGGNTEIIARYCPKHGVRVPEAFFGISRKDYRYLWGLDDVLMTAVRDALDRKRPRTLLDEKISFLKSVLEDIRNDAEKEREEETSDQSSQRHITEFGTEYGNWFKG